MTKIDLRGLPTLTLKEVAGKHGVSQEAILMAIKRSESRIIRVKGTSYVYGRAGKQLVFTEYSNKHAILLPILTGEIQVRRSALERYGKQVGVSYPTLLRWIKRYQREGVLGLQRRERSDKGKVRYYVSREWDRLVSFISEEKKKEISEELTKIIRGFWAQGSTGPQAQLFASLWLTEKTAELLSVSPEQIEKYCVVPISKVYAEKKYSIISIKERDAKRFYDISPYIKRSATHLKPGDIVVGDITPVDIPVYREDGSIVYPRLIVWQDVATRMIYATVFVPEKGEGVRRDHVALSFAKMCSEAPWGLPKALYLDNGAEFSWQTMIDGWRELKKLTHGAFEAVWINGYDEKSDVVRTKPYRPRGKLVESTFSALLKKIAVHPSFAGSDRMRKKSSSLGKGEAPTSIEDLTKFIAQVVNLYNNKPQAGHLEGKSPAEKMKEFLDGGFTPVHVAQEVIEFVFAEKKLATVKAGRVRVNNADYYSEKLVKYHDEKIEIRWVPWNPSRIYAYVDGEVVIAELVPVVAFDDTTGAKIASQLQKRTREAVEILAGQVVRLDIRNLFDKYAQMKNNGVVEEAQRRSIKVKLTKEQEQMLKAREEYLQQQEQKQKQVLTLKRFAVEEDEEVKRLAQKLNLI